MRSKKFGKIAIWILLGVYAAIGLALFLGYVVMLLWNWLMPLIFRLITISYWQAVCIIILAKILFGGFGHRRYRTIVSCGFYLIIITSFNIPFPPL